MEAHPLIFQNFLEIMKKLSIVSRRYTSRHQTQPDLPPPTPDKPPTTTSEKPKK